MLSSLNARVARAVFSGPGPRLVAIAAIALTLLAAPPSRPSAEQQPSEYLHLNPVIDKIVHNKVAIGVITSDMSVQNARALAREDIDYVYVDMEHSPLRLDDLEHFIAAMIDPAAILKKGNTQPNVAVFARFPPYPSEGNLWIAKQALDLGVMGLLFNELETKEEAMKFVPGMRKSPRKGHPYTGPIGTRGSGGGPAAWFWGVSSEEYNEHADLWPLNPHGDLLMLPMMETIEGVRNSAEIAKVPGVSALYIPGGGDLSTSLGVTSSSPEVEQAKQIVLQSCRTLKIVCGARASNPAEVSRRIKEGFKFITLGHVDGGLNYEAGVALRAARQELRAAGEK